MTESNHARDAKIEMIIKLAPDQPDSLLDETLAKMLGLINATPAPVAQSVAPKPRGGKRRGAATSLQTAVLLPFMKLQKEPMEVSAILDALKAAGSVKQTTTASEIRGTLKRNQNVYNELPNGSWIYFLNNTARLPRAV